MRTMILGLSLSLIGGAALAQTPPVPAQPPKPAAAQSTPNVPPSPPAMAPAPGMASAPGMRPGPQADGESPAGPPEGEIVETPDGVYLVRPGQGPMPLESSPRPSRSGPGDMADDDGMSTLPRPHPPRPRPEGKGARFRIQTPAMTLGVKCPDDEPMKACVDAVSGLLDKAAPPPHS